MKRGRNDWDEFARREPYFAVLTDRRFLRDQLDDDARRIFFESGEADVEWLFATIRDRLDAQFDPASALDFGCGVGRLTLPLARRAARVVGYDISPEMTRTAAQNAAEAELHNVEFVTSLSDVREEKFDFICSLIVFQHMPVRDGLAALCALLDLLAPGGVAALHFALRRPGSAVRRMARRVRAAIPLVHRLAGRLRRDPLRLPYMQMNTYSEDAIVSRMTAATGHAPVMVPRDDGDVVGAVFIVRKGRGLAAPARAPAPH